MARNIADLLGKDADYLLKHQSKTILKEQLHTPSPDFVDKVFAQTNRNTQVLRKSSSFVWNRSFSQYRIRFHSSH